MSRTRVTLTFPCTQEGEVQYLTTEAGGHFTGNYIGLYSTGNGRACQTGAVFSEFSYEGGRTEEFLR